MAARLQARDGSRCAPDDNRPLNDESKNGMNAAGSVMKAAGERTKAGPCRPRRSLTSAMARARHLFDYAPTGYDRVTSNPPQPGRTVPDERD